MTVWLIQTVISPYRIKLFRGIAEMPGVDFTLVLLSDRFRVRPQWKREVGTLPFRVEVPFGVMPGKQFQVQDFPLEPGDRIVLLTDGMQERNAATLDVAAALAASTDLHPRELVHELGAAVLHATGGDLRDDATMVCLDWYGGPRRQRATEQGADVGRASAAR